jgi:hypothetical protein
MLATAAGVSWAGPVRGQKNRSSTPQARVEARFHSWYRPGSSEDSHPAVELGDGIEKVLLVLRQGLDGEDRTEAASLSPASRNSQMISGIPLLGLGISETSARTAARAMPIDLEAHRRRIVAADAHLAKDNPWTDNVESVFDLLPDVLTFSLPQKS